MSKMEKKMEDLKDRKIDEETLEAVSGGGEIEDMIKENGFSVGDQMHKRSPSKPYPGGLSGAPKK